MRAICQQLVTVHRQHTSANNSVFTGHHLHLAMPSAVQPTHIQTHAPLVNTLTENLVADLHLSAGKISVRI